MPAVQTKTQEEMDREAHADAVDLRIVQVGAVAVGREVLRLLAGVDAGVYDADRVRAILVSCHNFPREVADALTEGAKTTQKAIGRVHQRLLRRLVGQLRMVRTSESGKDKACRAVLTVGDRESKVAMDNLDASVVGLVSKGMQLGVDAARVVLERMLEDLPPEEAPAPRAPLVLPDGSTDWVGAYAFSVMGMPVLEVESADRQALMARVSEHMTKLGEELAGGPVIISRDTDRETLQRLDTMARQLRQPSEVPAPAERPEPITTPLMRLSEAALRRFFQTASEKEIEDMVDGGLRHRGGVREEHFIRHWCAVARHFGYATRDDSPGELEKTFAIMVKRLVMAERRSPPPAE